VYIEIFEVDRSWQCLSQTAIDCSMCWGCGSISVSGTTE